MSKIPLPGLNDADENHAENSDVNDVNDDEISIIQEPRLWNDQTWTARVLKNEEDEGWAVAMYKLGESDPALVVPWTMGRDKKNPKPLDGNAFRTLVKNASEVLRRHQQQLDAQLHKYLYLSHQGNDYRINFDIVPDEEHPYALLSAYDAEASFIAKVQVSAGFKFNQKTAQNWLERDFSNPE